MIAYIIVVISFLLDGILTNYLPYLVNNLSFFTPSLTLVSIIVIYTFYRKKEEKYFLTVFIIGFIYDLFYTNLLFFNASLFLITAFIITRIQKKIEFNALNLLIEVLLSIIIYESITGLLLFIYNIVPVDLYSVFYKITHSILLNVIYAELVYLIAKIIPKKYKKISIN